MRRQTVLVTDGEQRAALAVVRSLGRAGYDVRVCSARGRSLAGASRHCRREAKVSDPLTRPETFVADVLSLAREWNVEILVPISEAALLGLLPQRSRFEAVQIPFAEHAAFRRISDKQLVLDSAPQYGIGVPEQWPLSRRDEAVDPSTVPNAFPLAIKPSRSVAEQGGHRTILQVEYARDRTELVAAVERFPEAAFPLLLQRRVAGPGVGIFLLVWDGRLVAAFSHRRIREKPPSGGVSVYRESIPADPTLVARSRALLEHFGWRGVAMVEYKLDDATGTPYLMEINGRFWGSLQLAIDSGVDFPTLLLSAAAGESPPAVLEYRVGVRSRWWWGDVDHLLARLRSNGNGSEPEHERSRWRALRDFLVIWRPGDRNEVLRFDDPWPIVRESIEWMHGR